MTFYLARERTLEDQILNFAQRLPAGSEAFTTETLLHEQVSGDPDTTLADIQDALDRMNLRGDIRAI